MSERVFFSSYSAQIEIPRYRLLRDGFVAPRLDGRRMRSWDTFYSEIAAACQFPTYFGRNFAATADLLTDFEWLPAGKGRVLCIAFADDVLVDEDAEELGSAVDLFEGASEYWRGGTTDRDIWGNELGASVFAVVLHSALAPGDGSLARWRHLGGTLTSFDNF
ncbi:barstar family protein [Leifsonia sp. ZF2019]|uniref:barstar family protein n=1 Tax=Leifsonia sp. ZF2019 TaxID=2781978 RepID=UPI001CBFAAD7|nr:barstar family protein [Leifsonia sp. ZF2019]UAJ79411.1 barstar family protein [Leifsonia sp. ZF2019]